MNWKLLLFAVVSFYIACAPGTSGKSHAELLIEKHIDTIGGNEILSKVENIHMKGFIVLTKDTVSSEVWIVKPDKLYSTYYFKRFFELDVKETRNGDRGITVSEGYPSEWDREDFDRVRDDCYIFPMLYYKDWKYQLSLLQDKTINDVICKGVLVERPEMNNLELYFDKETHLLKQRIVVGQDTMTILDYTWINDILYPIRLETSSIEHKSIMIHYDSIFFNSKIDTTLFSIDQDL